jgi:hypothetical protein
MLDAKAITSRRAVYAQCIADAGECLMKARSNGKEKEVAKLQDRIWLLMWAREILCNYALPGETPDAQLCSTDKDVRCAMRLADPGCVKCGCQGFVSNPIPAPPPCDIKYDIYVRDTVDASEYTPTVGLKPQLIISNVNSVTNEWSGHVGEVVQEPNFSTVPIGSVVYSQIGATFWIQTPAGIGAYFPGLTAEQVDSTHITVTSAWPNVNDYQGYNIVIEAMVNGVWVPLYSGTDNLVTPQTYDIEAPATSVRYTYMTKDCKYGPYTAGTLSDPPIPVCGVPDLEYNWVSVGGGLQNLEVTMNTSADFTPGEMYVEQDDTPTSPQTFGALPDTLTFGPFSAGEVTVHLVNLITDCPPYVENIGVPFVCGEGPSWTTELLYDPYVGKMQVVLHCTDLSSVTDPTTFTFFGDDGALVELLTVGAAVGDFQTEVFDAGTWQGITVVLNTGNECSWTIGQIAGTPIITPCSDGLVGQHPVSGYMQPDWSQFIIRTTNGYFGPAGTGVPGDDIILTPSEFGSRLFCALLSNSTTVTKVQDVAGSQVYSLSLDDSSVEWYDLSNNDLLFAEEIDFTYYDAIKHISVRGGEFLTSVIPPSGTPPLEYVKFANCALSEVSVDGMFNACDASISGGYCETSGAEPTAASATKRGLLNAAGWTLISNGVVI